MRKSNLTTLEWCSKRFFEFRIGNKFYVGFTFALLNFVIIFQRFFIESIDSVHEVVSNIVIFTILFLIIYVPIATVFGNNYYKNQHRVDYAMMFSNSSGIIKFYKLLFDLKTNSADPKEVEAFRKMLHKFEDKSKVTFLK